MINKDKKVLATIKDVFYGYEDHGIWTCYITLEMGYTQSFGGLFLDKEVKGPDFCKSVSSLLGVDNIYDLVGKKCYALYNFGENNETIEGIQNIENENRFTITKFSRRYDPKTQSRLKRKEEDLKREIIRAQEQIKATRVKLKVLKKNYTDWEV